MVLYAKLLGPAHLGAILFIPGMTGSSASWGDEFQALGRRHRLIMVDTLGFGHSPKPDIDYALDEHLSSLAETLDAHGIGRVHVVGHSMGALLGLPWFQGEAQARAHISKSSLFHRLMAMDTPLAHVACLAMCALRPLLLPVMPMLVRDVPPMVAKGVLRHTWHSYSRTLRNVLFRAETTKWMREIEHPVLIIQGRRDRTAPLKFIRANLGSLRRAWPVELIELDADHGPVFTHGAAITAEVEKFLGAGD